MASAPRILKVTINRTCQYCLHHSTSRTYPNVHRWAGAVALGVNIFVFPITSETELRQTLILSLDHIGTLTHLLAKTYTLTLTDEDRALRDKLSQTIRVRDSESLVNTFFHTFSSQQDFGLLNLKVGAAAIEINWTRWSIQDYHVLISQTRKMQLSLISLYSSLAEYEKMPAPLFEEKFLPSTIFKFHQLCVFLPTCSGICV